MNEAIAKQTINVLYIERSQRLDSVVGQQIACINQRVDTCVLSLFHHLPTKEPPAGWVYGCVPFFPCWERMKAWLFVRAARRWSQRIVNTHKKFDLIHSHFAYPDGLAARAVAKDMGIPYLVSGRGSDILVYPNENSYLRNIISLVLREAGAILGVSNNLLDIAVDLGAYRNRCYHIPSGFNDAVFKPSATCIHVAPPVILFVGAMLPVKNVFRMLEAFAIVSRFVPDVRFRLVGEGPLAGELQARAGKGILNGRCEFPGYLQPEIVAKEMSNATVLCLSSISEGWPNVIMESLASGTPVVASSVGGIPEQIKDGVHGFLCDPYEPKDIADKLMRALVMNWSRDDLIERSRPYSRENMVARIIAIYHKLLAGRRKCLP